MSNSTAVAFVTSCLMVGGCGAVLDSAAIDKEGECFTVEPAAPLNNTAELASGAQGGGS